VIERLLKIDKVLEGDTRAGEIVYGGNLAQDTALNVVRAGGVTTVLDMNVIEADSLPEFGSEDGLARIRKATFAEGERVQALYLGGAGLRSGSVIGRWIRSSIEGIVGVELVQGCLKRGYHGRVRWMRVGG
jgi:hypothetical protein